MQWLVSLRDPAELPAALAAEVDLLDLKDVRRGSLGMASGATIAAFSRQLQQVAPDRPFSVALGELGEWTDARAPISLPNNVGWAKLGLSRCAGDCYWTDRWIALRRRIDQVSGHAIRWIAVAYADAELAESPSPEDILAAAVATNCWGFLIDTYAKSGRTLLDWLGPERLRQLIVQTQTAGLRIALAGQVAIDDVATLADLQPDILAIRSAVCVDGVRTQPLCPTRLAQFRQQITTVATRRDPARAK